MKQKEKNNVLVIDDEPANIIALRQILSPEYTVYGATDGKTGLEVAKDKTPDVILLDIIMPYMDGYEILSKLKKGIETKNTPVIFITGLRGDSAEEKGLDLGADDYIVKPFNSSNVLLRVRNLMKIVNRTRTINEQLKQQALITKISHNFVSGTDTGTLITDSLRMIGEFMDVAHVLLYKFDDDKKILTCRNEWLNPKLQQKSQIGEEFISNEIIDKAVSEILKSEEGYACLHSNNPVYNEAMKPHRTEYKCYITAPIYVKREINAILDFAKEDEDYIWSENEIDLAILISNIFSSAFEREAMENAEKNRELAERSSRAKSEFLSRMSHEMLTPMNTIIGMLQVVNASLSDEKTIRNIGEIDKASRHLLSMIHGVLDLSGGSGSFSLDAKSFSLKKMIGSIIKSIDPELDKKQQKLSVFVASDIPDQLIGDDKRMARVILHLLTNAMKFSPDEGEIWLNFSISEEEREIIILRVEVKDNGIGISAEDQNDLFTVFEQVDGSITRKYAGIGIGLPLSRCIIELMGGSIWVESEPGKGAKFIFTCRLIKDK